MKLTISYWLTQYSLISLKKPLLNVVTKYFQIFVEKNSNLLTVVK